ncbi:hypothetical protein G9464_10895 [Halostella sp. JP-L12]|uniref:hypothetical protein n=1 Tax=Halostella TaxID=1843185 RepID=UPI0013CEC178|nr:MULTISPECIES: hypothetical protein [Halostella]NHN48104.1 hypothetical protein [Halostella sp. JP-L12]
MTDDDMTGPWILALGTLAVGTGAVAAKLLQRRSADSGGRSADEEARSDPDPEDADGVQ